MSLHSNFLYVFVLCTNESLIGVSNVVVTRHGNEVGLKRARTGRREGTKDTHTTTTTEKTRDQKTSWIHSVAQYTTTA